MLKRFDLDLQLKFTEPFESKKFSTCQFLWSWTIIVSNIVSFKAPGKKLKFEISRLPVTLTFDPRSLKLFKLGDFVIN